MPARSKRHPPQHACREAAGSWRPEMSRAYSPPSARSRPAYTLLRTSRVRRRVATLRPGMAPVERRSARDRPPACPNSRHPVPYRSRYYSRRGCCQQSTERGKQRGRQRWPADQRPARGAAPLTTGRVMVDGKAAAWWRVTPLALRASALRRRGEKERVGQPETIQDRPTRSSTRNELLPLLPVSRTLRAGHRVGTTATLELCCRKRDDRRM